MASLYEIDAQIMECVDFETGEIIDKEKLEALQLEFDKKVEGIALWVKNLLAEAKMVKEEKDALAARQKSCENKADSLKRYLETALGGEKFKTPRVSISYRKSESVQVDDMDKLDDDYLKYTTPTVDKTRVKQALKQGIKLEGVQLVENNNIQIK